MLDQNVSVKDLLTYIKHFFELFYNRPPLRSFQIKTNVSIKSGEAKYKMPYPSQLESFSLIYWFTQSA